MNFNFFFQAVLYTAIPNDLTFIVVFFFSPSFGVLSRYIVLELVAISVFLEDLKEVQGFTMTLHLSWRSVQEIMTWAVSVLP